MFISKKNYYTCTIKLILTTNQWKDIETDNSDSVSRGLNINAFNWYKCGGRNMPTTWSLTGENMTEKHYASYPKKLVARMLKAGVLLLVWY
jgi:hypothetical protein